MMLDEPEEQCFEDFWCRTSRNAIRTGYRPSRDWDHCSPGPDVDYKGKSCMTRCKVGRRNVRSQRPSAPFYWCDTYNTTDTKQDENIWGYCSPKLAELYPKRIPVVVSAFPLNKVRYYLWTQQNPWNDSESEKGAHQVLNDNETTIRSSYFNPSIPTVILSHGWLGDAFDFAGNFVSSYLKLRDCNVISIDWSDLMMYNYFIAKTRPEPVGREAAKLVVLLHDNFNVALDNIHLVGFSLGAHVVGFLGREVQEQIKNDDGSPKKVGRITGLDPAGVFIENLKGNRIDRSDAGLVDIIHTSHLAFPRALGHVDFYPAGGKQQPGCPWTGSDFEMCSHMRAKEYFRESIVPDSTKFTASLCCTMNDATPPVCVPKDPFIKAHDMSIFQKAWADGPEDCCGRKAAWMGEWLKMDLAWRRQDPKKNDRLQRQYYFLDVAAEAPYGRGVEGKPKGCPPKG